MHQTSAIFASKLFKTSSRKDKIRAAYLDPMNAELVKQIDSYVDPEYRKYTESELDNTSKNLSDNEDDNQTSSGSDSQLFSGGGSFSGRGGSLPGMITDDSDESSDEGFDGDLDGELNDSASEGSDDLDNESSDDLNNDIEESTKITASTCHDVSSELDIIKGTLNAVSDTSGVIRILVKEKELWIYYNDKINLNDVMLNVIDSLHNAGYNYLEFSRLARSDNAVVFDIFESSTRSNEVEDDGEKKEA